MVTIGNITKSFGGQLLFEGATFNINPRERVGLVGRNGHGKTTLFRLIVGEEHPDEGTISFPKGYRVGYVVQDLRFTEDSVLKEGMKALREEEQGHHWKVEKILAGLGFSNEEMHRHPEVFSGGYQVRLNLAKVLVSQPDLLLLDEPTNYLDITSIRWIERFLINWPRELMLITHDRGFMDKVVTHTVGVHRKKIRKIAGNTGKLYNQIAQEEEIYEQTRTKDERRQKQIEAFINRFRAKARLANLVQSRIKTLEKKKKKEKLETIKELDFSFRDKPFRAKYLLSARNLSFSYNSSAPLIGDLSITIGAGERVCVVGPNGKGKTTLLKLLAGVLKANGGEIVSHPGVTSGYFEQTNVKSLVDSRTVEEEMLSSYADVDRQVARNICGAMMFEGDDALKRIEVLSGGEKSRVMLGKLLAMPVNLLLLDEPTNHLDMYSCDALLAAIDSFEGAVVIVTHNEMFLHALADRLIVFQNGRVEVFEGSYQRFIEKGGWGDEGGLRKSAREDEGRLSSSVKMTKKEKRRRRSEIITERGKIQKPLEARIIQVENEIEDHERELKAFNDAMVEASQAKNGKGIVKISQSIHQCQSAIDRLFNELEELTSTLEEQTAVFENQLNELEQSEEA